ncbi:VOC family protein [Halomonas janggokensis]|uniref:2-oxoadipate dioxygenase/decarboxylase n=1 Tax=Vreelandella janggokensis TaxID=370767 RepID=A0ABT4IX29_9GAMM|nr:VOC family protein [Halomonas janggokensis]MCZ0927529.1 VOC family protein [Halomonas janggokensis]MCZ0930037.1 VOC family protein [Halomonas janggokensis]
MSAAHVSSDDIRDQFSKAMSAMYQQEVPQYSALLSLVAAVNEEVLAASPALRETLAANNALERLDVERHGAIRVGTPEELALLRRMFAVMGMLPVGYYDLAPAGVPVHSTAFRPVDDAALSRNPFRIFTSLLRLELIEDTELRQQAREILDARRIVTPQAEALIETFERQGGLTADQAAQFVDQALETFRWHDQATVDLVTYQRLQQEHRLIADVVCFKGPHINHLTPRTLDIDEVQRRMPQVGIDPKAIIEGPPRRRCPILLRQTSFKALEEPIAFADAAQGHHTARFGEIEQRGIALTHTGRALYDRLLGEAKQAAEAENPAHQARLAAVFEAFPDDEATLRREGLAFFHYHAIPGAQVAAPVDVGDVERLLAQGALTATPMTYEDFLPVSAAGIFQSNLGDNGQSGYAQDANQQQFEQALGVPVTDEVALYAKRQQASLDQALAQLTGNGGANEPGFFQ